MSGYGVFVDWRGTTIEVAPSAVVADPTWLDDRGRLKVGAPVLVPLYGHGRVVPGSNDESTVYVRIDR